MLLRNVATAQGNWLADPRRGDESNRFGLGATVRVQTPGRLQVREINNAASYLSANDTRLHVGLGDAKTIQQARDPLAERIYPDADRRAGQSDPGDQGTVVGDAYSNNGSSRSTTTERMSAAFSRKTTVQFEGTAAAHLSIAFNAALRLAFLSLPWASAVKVK